MRHLRHGSNCFILVRLGGAGHPNLVWLANRTGKRKMLTADEADVSVYRIKGGKDFALLKWFD